MALNVEDKLFEIAGDIGKVQTAVDNMKSDIDVLFNCNREIKKDIGELSNKVSIIETKATRRPKAFISLTAVLMFLKKLIGLGGGS